LRISDICYDKPWGASSDVASDISSEYRYGEGGVRLTEFQDEVLKTLANASGDTPDEWLHNDLQQLKQEVADLLAEDAKADELTSLPFV
jgi:hypothetical protein